MFSLAIRLHMYVSQIVTEACAGYFGGNLNALLLKLPPLRLRCIGVPGAKINIPESQAPPGLLSQNLQP